MNNATITLIIIGAMCVMYIVDRFPVALVTLLGMLAMIYDMKERTYLEAVMMDPDLTLKIHDMLEGSRIEFFMTTLEHHVLIYRYGGRV